MLEDIDAEVAMTDSNAKAACLSVPSILGGVLKTGIPVSVLMLEGETTEVAICCLPSEVLEPVLNSVVAAAKISLLRVLRCVANAEEVGVRVVAKQTKRRTRNLYRLKRNHFIANFIITVGQTFQC